MIHRLPQLQPLARLRVQQLAEHFLCAVSQRLEILGHLRK